MADSEASTQTKRCPRCETTKHRSEFNSQGYCRPCGTLYSREREAKKAELEGRPPPKPRAASAVTESAKVEPTAPKKTIRDIADKVAPPHCPARIDPESRRRTIAFHLSGDLLELLQSGERLNLVVTRVGAAILIDSIEIDVVST